MSISIQQYAEALYLALQETSPKDHDTVIDNFVSILTTNGDLAKYESIVAEYERLDADGQGIKKAEVTFAREVEVNKRIIEELNTVIGSKITVEKKVDESVIGGMVVRVDDTLIDASVRGSLDTLKRKLSE